MAYCRCTTCRTRKTLPRPPEQYARALPKCPKCGDRRWTRDHYRAKHERGPKAPKCNCHKLGQGFYWFPHRKGSRLCHHNPRLTPEIAEAAHEALSQSRRWG